MSMACLSHLSHKTCSRHWKSTNPPIESRFISRLDANATASGNPFDGGFRSVFIGWILRRNRSSLAGVVEEIGKELEPCSRRVVGHPITVRKNQGAAAVEHSRADLSIAYAFDT